MADRKLDEAALRVSDADRERMVDRLRHAHGEGYLDLAEFDERAVRSWRATTRGELAAVAADLPASTERTPQRVTRRQETAVPRRPVTLYVSTASWLGASVLNLVIWLIVSVSAGGPVYPWWVWVAGPWGLVVALRWLSGVGAGRGLRALPKPCRLVGSWGHE